MKPQMSRLLIASQELVRAKPLARLYLTLKGRLTACRLRRPSSVEEEPSAPLRLIDPVFEQACAGDIAMLVAKIARLAHVGYELLVIVAQLSEHI